MGKHVFPERTLSWARPLPPMYVVKLGQIPKPLAFGPSYEYEEACKLLHKARVMLETGIAISKGMLPHHFESEVHYLVKSIQQFVSEPKSQLEPYENGEIVAVLTGYHQVAYGDKGSFTIDFLTESAAKKYGGGKNTRSFHGDISFHIMPGTEFNETDLKAFLIKYAGMEFFDHDPFKYGGGPVKTESQGPGLPHEVVGPKVTSWYNSNGKMSVTPNSYIEHKVGDLIYCASPSTNHKLTHLSHWIEVAFNPVTSKSTYKYVPYGAVQPIAQNTKQWTATEIAEGDKHIMDLVNGGPIEGPGKAMTTHEANLLAFKDDDGSLGGILAKAKATMKKKPGIHNDALIFKYTDKAPPKAPAHHGQKKGGKTYNQHTDKWEHGKKFTP